ncbi:MAG: RtcB family protein, partial [Candidatus Thermoplasmatota archaeon]|nr:RtcB family protein [Candidatus Thermoplasmatota archaeon]
MMEQLRPAGKGVFELPQQGDMRVPGRIYSTPELLAHPGMDSALQQVANVATLPGIVDASLAMPDIHWGYGFPIGGVAAFDANEGGVVSPGGVGFDINCGVRLLRTDLEIGDVLPRQKELVDELFKRVPAGLGSKSTLALSNRELDSVL